MILRVNISWPAIGRIFFNKVVAGLVGAEKDEASIKVGEQMLNRDLPIFEAALAPGNYVTGEKMTLADITLLAALEPAEMIGLDLFPLFVISEVAQSHDGT